TLSGNLTLLDALPLYTTPDRQQDVLPRVAGTTEPPRERHPGRSGSVQIVVPHELTTGLGDRTGQRRVHRERQRQVVHGELVLHGQRDRQDQLAGVGCHHDTTHHDPRGRPAEQLHEAVVHTLHLGARVRGQRKHDGTSGDLTRVDGL